MLFKRILVSIFASCLLTTTVPSFSAEIAPKTDAPLLRIGYIESSFSPSERKGFQDTFEYLQFKLPQYNIRIQNYLVKDLERGVRNNEFEFFIKIREETRGLMTWTTLNTR